MSTAADPPILTLNIALRRLQQNDPSLVHLDLFSQDHQPIGDEGAQAIAEALLENTSLSTLKLGDNNIGAEGAQAIAKTLRINTSLRTLWLGGNNIGDRGAEAIAVALQTNTTLQNLNLFRKITKLEIKAPKRLRKRSASIIHCKLYIFTAMKLETKVQDRLRMHSKLIRR